MTLEQRLAEIEKRVNSATPGPWEVSGTGQQVLHAAGDPVTNMRICESNSLEDRYHGKTVCWANIAFIANAREDVPLLLAIFKKAIEQRNRHIDTIYANADEVKFGDDKELMEVKP